MIAYCDSSVLVRFILEQPDSLVELAACDQLVTSVVTRVECLRAIKNARLRGELSDDELAGRRRAASARLRGIERIEASPSILGQAERSFGVALPVSTSPLMTGSRLVRPLRSGSTSSA